MKHRKRSYYVSTYLFISFFVLFVFFKGSAYYALSADRSHMVMEETQTNDSNKIKFPITEIEKMNHNELQVKEQQNENVEKEEIQDVQEGENDIPEEGKFLEGNITIDKIIYKCYSNGEASIINASKATGNFVVPREITGLGDANYLVTVIGGYTAETGLRAGAFQWSKITSLSFEEGSQLKTIEDYAFNECYGLAGTSIDLPDTLTYIGKQVFNLYFNNFGIAELRHPHIIKVNGHLPNMSEDNPLLPEEALQYESTVNSSQDNTVLHKGSRWTNEDLTEAEIRIDYGYRPISNKVDYIFVIDYSHSMLDSTEATGENGVSYMYPRSFITNDIMYSISDIILNNNVKEYDNRIAMVTFGTPNKPIWISEFTKSSEEIEETLFKKPLSLANYTNYSAGLQGAIDLIKDRDDASRMPVVIFLSDGLPNDGYGIDQANTLRNMGVKVYPLAIYMKPNKYLTDISFDGMTAYNAEDTDSFQRIITQVVDDIITQEPPLSVSIQDKLSPFFEFATGTGADITLSDGGGKATINGDILTWDLTGCDPSKVHNVRIKVKLKSGTEFKATGSLPTNTAMGAIDGSIVSKTQPQLGRYLVNYIFENETNPDEPLPGEVMALLPNSHGGYRDKSEVTAAELSTKEVVLDNGDRWQFVGWKSNPQTINSNDVTFIGVWKLAFAEFSFIKTDAEGIGLPEAEFELYHWKGNAEPTEKDTYVTSENTSRNKWVKTNEETIVSGKNGAVDLYFQNSGFYQLVEIIPPRGYYKPKEQWSFTIDSNFLVNNIESILKENDSKIISEFNKYDKDGTNVWFLNNYKIADFEFLKISKIIEKDNQVTYKTLNNAVFELYLWTADRRPTEKELVNYETLKQGLWELIETTVSQDGGKVKFNVPAKKELYYQLVEKQAPLNYQLPSGQWRIAFTSEGTVDSEAIKSIPGKDGEAPPSLEMMTDGLFTGKITLLNNVLFELPATGGRGIYSFITIGVVSVSFATFVRPIFLLLKKSKLLK